MSIHLDGLTIGALTDASLTARTVDHAVTIVDDAARVVVVVDPRGRVRIRPDERVPSG
jgi:hypothetical protein